MSKKIGIEVSIAAADAVGLCNVDVVAAYPDYSADPYRRAPLRACCRRSSGCPVCPGGIRAQCDERLYRVVRRGGADLHVDVFAGLCPDVGALLYRRLTAFAHSDGCRQPCTERSDQHLERPCRPDVCPGHGWIQTIAENGQEVVDLMIHASARGRSQCPAARSGQPRWVHPEPHDRAADYAVKGRGG